MLLPNGGIDVWYVDESVDRDILAMSAIAIPFLRHDEGNWKVVWEDHFKNLRDWRRLLSKLHGIPVSKELKGSKLVGGRGRYLKGKHQLKPLTAVAAYRWALTQLGFLPPSSIVTVIGTPNSTLYGHGRLEAVLFALLQRMRTASAKTGRLGMIFFDEGHGEYRKLYRKARVYLPTGSAVGDWGSGQATKNLPLDNFVKDANIKESAHCFFTQLADLLSFAALSKLRGEFGTLPATQNGLGLTTLYASIPGTVLNTKASSKDPLGLVRLT